MGLYEMAKEAMSLAQKADNIDLYRQLLDLSAQALEMQNEIRILKEEKQSLREKIAKKERIIRHKGMYITLEGDELEIPYCPVCYGKQGLLVQMVQNDEHDRFWDFYCHNCDMGYYK